MGSDLGCEWTRKEGRRGRRKKLREDGERQFWFFLSTRFGIPVCELQQRMPYTEFVEQLAYHRLFAWGDDWDQAAVQAHAAVQPHVRKQMRIEDFRPKAPKPHQSNDDILNMFKALAEQQKAKGNGR